MKRQCVRTEIQAKFIRLQGVPGGIYHILEERSLVKFTLIEDNLPVSRVER